VGHVLDTNLAHAVRGPKYSQKKGKTPVLNREEARALLAAIDTNSLTGLRDRALIGVMIYTFARVGAVLQMNVGDYFSQGRRGWVRLHEKGGKEHEAPCVPKLEAFLDEYIETAARTFDVLVFFLCVTLREALLNTRMGLRQPLIARMDEPAQSSFVRPRSFLDEDRCDFAVSRRTLEPSVGRLGRRVFDTTCARAISSFRRARASARLASCVRCTRGVMINTPSCMARLPANARRRCRTSAGSERDCPTSNRSWTAVETLLTFWPPGPEARTNVIVSSESGMNMGKCYFQNSP